MKYKLGIYGILLIMLSICGYAWYVYNTDDLANSVKDFSLNAFTEILGIFITIAFVDVLMGKWALRQSLPQKAAIYEEIRLLVARIVGFWADAYKFSVPENSPESIGKLFSEDNFLKIFNNLNLQSSSNVINATGKITWMESLLSHLQDQQKRLDKIISRYSSIMDPEIFLCISDIGNDGLSVEQIMSIVEWDVTNKCPRPKILGAYYSVSNNFCKNVVKLASWCEKEYYNVHKIRNYTPKLAPVINPWEKQENPPSRMAEAEKERQSKAFAEFQQNSTIKK